MKKPEYRFVIYKDKKKEFRYRVFHRNGKEIFKSSEGYKRKTTMLKSWYRFFNTPLAIDDTTKGE
jgi:uncharacterized protein YegP (UPF0339 family)